MILHPHTNRRVYDDQEQEDSTQRRSTGSMIAFAAGVVVLLFSAGLVGSALFYDKGLGKEAQRLSRPTSLVTAKAPVPTLAAQTSSTLLASTPIYRIVHVVRSHPIIVAALTLAVLLAISATIVLTLNPTEEVADILPSSVHAEQHKGPGAEAIRISAPVEKATQWEQYLALIVVGCFAIGSGIAIGVLAQKDVIKLPVKPSVKLPVESPIQENTQKSEEHDSYELMAINPIEQSDQDVPEPESDAECVEELTPSTKPDQKPEQSTPDPTTPLFAQPVAKPLCHIKEIEDYRNDADIRFLSDPSDARRVALESSIPGLKILGKNYLNNSKRLIEAIKQGMSGVIEYAKSRMFSAGGLHDVKVRAHSYGGIGYDPGIEAKDLAQVYIELSRTRNVSAEKPFFVLNDEENLTFEESKTRKYNMVTVENELKRSWKIKDLRKMYFYMLKLGYDISKKPEHWSKTRS